MDHMWSVVTTSTELSWRSRRSPKRNVRRRRAAKKDQLWKCRPCGKRQKTSLPSGTWKSLAQKQRDFPTFPQLLLLDRSLSKAKTKNRTFHLLQKADILTCYQQHFFEALFEDFSSRDNTAHQRYWPTTLRIFFSTRPMRTNPNVRNQ